jgi:hypothetical protein
MEARRSENMCRTPKWLPAKSKMNPIGLYCWSGILFWTLDRPITPKDTYLSTGIFLCSLAVLSSIGIRHFDCITTSLLHHGCLCRNVVLHLTKRPFYDIGILVGQYLFRPSRTCRTTTGGAISNVKPLHPKSSPACAFVNSAPIL